MKTEPMIDNACGPDLLGQEFDVPRLADYFQPWAIHEQTFRAAVARIGAIDLRLHVERSQQDPQAASPSVSSRSSRGRGYQITDRGVAVVLVSGPLMKFVSSLCDGTSTVYLRQQIRAAAGDKEVGAILLHIDSPGGTVSGTADLADEVKRAASKKPVYAFIEDLGASAAYWVASQATQVFANRTAAVGSIGTYGVIWDQSARAAMQGIKVHVLRAGAYKGAAEPGTEITPEQLAEWQRVIDEYNQFFLKAVAAGRPLSLAEVRALADGRVHIGQAAVDAKLIDGIQTLDDTLQAISSPSRSPQAMTTELKTIETAVLQTGTFGASLDDLKICCPGADNDFLIEQLSKKATVDQAQSAWMEEQNRRLQAAQKEAADAKAQAAAKAGSTGVLPITSGKTPESAGGDAIERFGAAVAQKMAERKCDRAKAVGLVVREQPELHQEYLDEYNAEHKPQRRR